MTKTEFERRVDAVTNATHDALAEVWDNLNHGQQQKLLKNEKIAELLRRYGVIDAG